MMQLVVQNRLDYTMMGDRIREQRQLLELTQGQLAKRAGVTASFIGHIERAEKVQSLETVARLSRALNTTMEWLVFGERQRCEGEACPLFADLEALYSAYGFRRKV